MRVETRSTVAAPKKRKPLFGGKKTKAAAKPSAKQVLAKERAANAAQKSSKKSKKKLTKKDKEKQLNDAKIKAEKRKQAELLAKSDNPSLVVRQHLHGPAKWIGDGELDQLVQMNTRIQAIQKRMETRVIYVVLGGVVGLVGGLFLKKMLIGLIGGLALGGVLWFMDIQKTSAYYRNYQLRRQIAFAQFTRLAAAYLPELAHGSNLYSVFNKLLPRMESDEDRAALQKLMIDMTRDPQDPTPFLEFARAFSVSDRAELIMLSIQQMYLGDVDDRNIRTLADDANQDMMRQVDSIINFKIKRFNNIATKIGMSAMIVVMGFLAILLAKTFGQTLGSTMKQTHF